MTLPRRAKPHHNLFAVREPIDAYGDGFGEWQVVEWCYIEDTRVMVRTASGQMVESNSSIWVDPDVLPSAGAEVSIWHGLPEARVAAIASVSTFRGVGLDHRRIYAE